MMRSQRTENPNNTSDLGQGELSFSYRAFSNTPECHVWVLMGSESEHGICHMAQLEYQHDTLVAYSNSEHDTLGCCRKHYNKNHIASTSHSSSLSMV